MSKVIEVPLSADSEQELASVLYGITGLVLNERIAAYNEGLDAGYEAAAKFVENGRFLSDEAPAARLAKEAAAGIRRLKLE